ncbi:MAG: TRAP transporter large permease [Actinomycetota bacterium]|nr:TRAP transporter large permease [Actinomycetota bacterium]
MTTASIVLFVVFFLLLLTTTPISVALGLSTFLYFFYYTTIPLTQVPDSLFNALNTFTLTAIPFFVFAANLMTYGGISRRLTEAANAAVGRFPGGLALTAVVSCMFFAAISGSSPATVVAVGTLLIPAMIKANYGRDFSTGIVATSGSLGILIPPSIPLIVYGIATEENIGDLFIAGFGPGLLGGLLLLGLVIFVSHRRGLRGQELPMTGRDRVKAFRDAILGLFLPFFVLGGIYGGYFTPTEAAAMAVLYALVVSLFVYREIGPRDLVTITVNSARMSAMIMFIIANAILFSFVLTSERIPDEVTNLLVGLDLPKWGFLLTINLFLLVVGCFMETSSAILILAPILVPVATTLGVNPIHLGIIMVMNLEIGMVTPPFGLNLFVASGLSGLTVIQVAKAALPSALVLLAALFLVTYVPEITLTLVEMGKSK